MPAGLRRLIELFQRDSQTELPSALSGLNGDQLAVGRSACGPVVDLLIERSQQRVIRRVALQWRRALLQRRDGCALIPEL